MWGTKEIDKRNDSSHIRWQGPVGASDCGPAYKTAWCTLSTFMAKSQIHCETLWPTTIHNSRSGKFQVFLAFFQVILV